MGMTALNFFLLGCMVFLIRGGIAFTVESIWIEGPKEEIKFCNAEVNLHCADRITHKCKSDGQDFTYICSWEFVYFS